MKTTRIAPGEYKMDTPAGTWTISYFPHLNGWIGQAQFDRDMCTDPLPTKARVVAAILSY